MYKNDTKMPLIELKKSRHTQGQLCSLTPFLGKAAQTSTPACLPRILLKHTQACRWRRLKFLEKLLTTRRGPTTQPQHPLPKGKQTWEEDAAAGREGVDPTGQVSSERAAPPKPSAAPCGPSVPLPASPSAPHGRPPGPRSAASASFRGPEGSSPLVLPQAPSARPLCEARGTASASPKSVHNRSLTLHPGASSRRPTLPGRRAPHHVLHSLAMCPKTEPRQVLPRPPASTPPGITTSTSLHWVTLIRGSTLTTLSR